MRSLLHVKGDTYYLDDPDQAKALHYRIRPESGGAAIAAGTVTLSAEYFLQDLVELPTAGPGNYLVVTSYDTFLRRGRVDLLTKSDSVTDFDDLDVSLPAK